jgi:hypothetical protein
MMRSTVLALLVVAACGGGGGGDDKSSFYAIALTTPDESFWAPTIHVGSQSFVMDLDTGSTSTAIAGSGCSTCQNVSPEYVPAGSAMDQQKTATTEYADGTGWMGEIYEDTLGLGSGSPDATFNIVDISTQVVGSQGMAGFFDGENDYQGILGMGSPENAEPDTGAYFATITAAGVAGTMAFELCDDGGTMWLGGYDETHAQAAAQYTPLLPINANENPFYSIDITSMSLNGTNVGMGSAAFQEPIVDTGTTFFYLPTNVESALIAAINASPAFQTLFPSTTLQDDPNGTGIGCTGTSSVTDAMVDAMLPPLVFTVPNEAGGADISFSVNALESYMFDGGQGQFCLGIANGGPEDGATLGDQFMQAFVTVIDVANQRVGFALDKGCSASASKRRSRDLSTFRPHLPKPRHK